MHLIAVLCASAEWRVQVKRSTAVNLKAVATTSGCLIISHVAKFSAGKSVLGYQENPPCSSANILAEAAYNLNLV